MTSQADLDPDPTRWLRLASRAVDMLRTRLYPEAVAHLIRLVNSDSPARYIAVELLGSIGGLEALVKLEAVAQNDRDANVQNLARKLVGQSR